VGGSVTPVFSIPAHKQIVRSTSGRCAAIIEIEAAEKIDRIRRQHPATDTARVDDRGNHRRAPAKRAGTAPADEAISSDVV
jgi:hypothetical protein